MLIYFLIPARGGSKGIIKKNIKLFANKPLIAWSIEQSIKSKFCDRVFVTTDDEDIKKISLEYGAECPFLRPSEISQDLSTDYEFMDHFIAYLIKEKIKIPDMIVQMRPTYPTRKIEIIDDIIYKFINNYDNYDSIRTIIENDRTPYKMYNINENKLVPLFQEIDGVKEPYNCPRQILPKTYLHNGYLDVIKPSIILDKKSISGDKILPYIMNKEEIDDIDTIEEWINAEKKYIKFK